MPIRIYGRRRPQAAKRPCVLSLNIPKSGLANSDTNAPGTSTNAKATPLSALPAILKTWLGRMIIPKAAQWKLNASQKMLIDRMRVQRNLGR
ncbi:MAG: hypothetical protein E6I32_03975 [Chloroflexi bacterium]|nr:MAG: hypothetical protein E6I32_03975 [Chloroflexota bacterium]